MRQKFSAIVIVFAIAGLLLPFPSLAAFDVPAGFSDQLVVDDLGFPTAFDFLPPGEEGEMLVAEQSGTVFLIDGSAKTNVLDISDTICAGGELGLLGLAVDPAMSSDSNRFVYLYYSDERPGGNCANRVSRFAVAANGTLGDEEVLIDSIPAPNGNHNGGDLQFDKDGLLHVSVGDGGRDLRTGDTQNGNGNARRLDLLVGKILRIETDGGIPAGNPFQGQGTTPCADSGSLQSEARGVQAEKKNKKHRKNKKNRKKRKNNGPATVCQEIFATGLRNPFRIAFDPDDTQGQQRFYINDVGGGAWEEIDEGAAGADYGWNVREGPCKVGSTSNCPPDNRFVDPIFAYDYDENCRTITGGAFVPDTGAWPDQYDDAYMFSDFACDKLFALRGQGSGATLEEFGTEEGAVHLRFGPDGALYYSTFSGDGQVRKIVD